MAAKKNSFKQALILLSSFFERASKSIKSPYYSNMAKDIFFRLDEDEAYLLDYLGSDGDWINDMPKTPTLSFFKQTIRDEEDSTIDFLLSPDGNTRIYGDWKRNWEYDSEGNLIDADPDYTVNKDGEKIIEAYGPRHPKELALRAIKNADWTAECYSIKDFATRIIRYYYQYDSAAYNIFVATADAYDEILRQHHEYKFPKYCEIVDTFDFLQFNRQDLRGKTYPEIREAVKKQMFAKKKKARK